MKKFILFFLISLKVFAQTGIGTTAPNPSAKLDVYSTNKGFLPPRVTLTSVTDASTIASPAEGLLVYNLGSVGLQAGYYYWNGANWATIATATSAGNGVTASNMVNLYSKAYSSAVGDIANASGFTFTVPVSGRYLFDFSCTGFSNATITYKVRQGTTDLGSDAQTSFNNTVHVEYNGKVEVNLQAGTTYNVFVTSTGSRDAGDYDRVYYKMVAGNLPVTGQSVDYVSVYRNSSQTLNTGDNIKFNVINAGNIPYDVSTGNFTLTANKTYRLSGNVTLSNGNTNPSEADIVWRTAAGTNLGNSGMILSMNHTTTAGGNGISDIIYTPTSNTTISLYVVWSSSNVTTQSNNVFANIEQIGSSAIVNPWTLSGTNTYNNLGKVGIGNTLPNATLDVRTSPTSTSDPGAGYIGIGTTSAAASTAGVGALRYNTSNGLIEFSNGSAWLSLSPGNTPMYAQFSSNTGQYFNAIGTKMLFQVTNINVGSMSNASNGTIYLPAGRIYRVDLNLGWANVGWSRFAIFNASSGAQLSQTAHVEGGTGYYVGTGVTTCFINTSAGAINIEARFVAPLNSNSLFGDTGNGGNYPSLTIQTVD
jgi:hypothetical protein